MLYENAFVNTGQGDKMPYEKASKTKTEYH